LVEVHERQERRGPQVGALDCARLFGDDLAALSRRPNITVRAGDPREAVCELGASLAVLVLEQLESARVEALGLARALPQSRLLRRSSQGVSSLQHWWRHGALPHLPRETTCLLQVVSQDLDVLLPSRGKPGEPLRETHVELRPAPLW
jgi:hypothetical protein